MNKNSLFYFTAGVLLAAVAYLAKSSLKDTVLLQQYAARLEAYLDKQERAALEWVRQEHAALQMAIQGQEPPDIERWAASLSEQSQQAYTVFLHSQDSVVFASNNLVSPSAKALIDLSEEKEQRKLVRLPAGYFYAYARPFKPGVTLSVWVPIALRMGGVNVFARELSFGERTEVVDVAEGEPVYAGGQALFGLSAKGSIQAAWVQIIMLIAVLLLVVLLLGWVSRWVLRLYEAGKRWLALALLSFTLLGLIGLNVATSFSRNALPELSLFAQPLEHSLLGARSIGDLLAHLLLILWFAMLFHRITRTERLGQRFSLPIRLSFSIGSYAVITGSIVGLLKFSQWLIFQSGIPFDFDNLLSFFSLSGLALVCVLVALLSLFLFHHRLLFSVHRCELSASERLLALGLGAGIGWALALAFGVSVWWGLIVVVLSVVYIWVFQRSIVLQAPRLVGLAVWLMLFSGLAAGTLYSFNTQRDRQMRLAYAEALAIGRDSTHAEPLLRTIAPLLCRDSILSNLLKPWPFRPLAADLRQRAYEILYPYSYLFQNYRLSVFAFDKEGFILPQDQPQDRAEVVQNNWENAVPLPDMPALRYAIAENGVFRYILRTLMWRMNDSTQPAEVLFFFDHTFVQPTRVYSELFYRQPYRGMNRLFSYDYAVQRRGILVVDQGEASRAVFAKDLPRGQAEERITRQPRRADAVYATADGTAAAAVGRSLGDIRKPIYLFSALFALCLVIIFVVALLNTWLEFFPAHYQLSFSGQGSLSKRIHYRTFGLIGIGFAGAIILTYRHFADQSRLREQADLDRRAEALLTYLRIQLGDQTPQLDSLAPVVAQFLAPHAASLATDVNFFSPRGQLLFSTQTPLTRVGVLPTRMSSEALVRLKTGLEQEVTVVEHAGGTTYTNRYLPLRNNQNVLLGFLGVPYSLSGRKLGPEVSDFLGLLASIYVFLMIIAYALSYTLSNSIISPLKLIADKIQRLKLEDKNEPLEYSAQAGDEISTLIEEYNRMVEKLEESKARLIRLEREGAWREMARQVAHDIKNPLTTIKLSMQQLERLSSDPTQVALYLKKAIARLIEQIDSLAQIATEFSLFANLDIRQKHDMVLNDVVESVYDLFTEDRNVELSIELPAERFHIQGDKNHLIRVFNNLIINAIQAIPPERKGRIELSVSRRGAYSVVRIRDNGGGIPPEIQKRVFEPNFTTKSSGSGLGLAICKRIVEAHDGRIYFETRLGEGTDFYVELPISTCEAPAEQPQETAPN